MADMARTAQGDPVTPADDIEAQFTSADPELHRNKQAAYKIFTILDEAGNWDRVNEFKTERYIQHDPFVPSGSAAVVKFFTETHGVKPRPVEDKLRMKVVAVVAEGDMVTIASARYLTNPHDPSETYTTTWFDMFRFVDGRADEHWDCATLDMKEAPNLVGV
ncbi:hypothetical protein EU805_14610 [Salipiger sp. IMCC34102]|uniref:nuclear transport factor 2 family protein n=1 Tax=Salipiger sp. IMCC34102 TaxID=2510647 RepID=UPI00101D5E4E|nr:nuclear transport factor 2 family protein [Salipiger sp. IMCC34102]RYH01228.1 hypothetical protein EU805_14610 [Salipiger sp. IMCC34102]